MGIDIDKLKKDVLKSDRVDPVKGLAKIVYDHCTENLRKGDKLPTNTIFRILMNQKKSTGAQRQSAIDWLTTNQYIDDKGCWTDKEWKE